MKNFFSKLSLIAMMFFPFAGFSEEISTDFLVHGFDMANYQSCQQKLTVCGTPGKILNEECVQKTIPQNKTCQQLGKLAKTLETSAGVITAKQVSNLVLVKVSYPADGAFDYYIITPEGDLIKTNIDPRNLDQQLASQYKDASFYTLTKDEPRYNLLPNGEQIVKVNIKVNNQCHACAPIGTAELKFHFVKNGEFDEVTVTHFNPA